MFIDPTFTLTSNRFLVMRVDWSEFLQQRMGLVRIPSGAYGTGQNSFWEQAELVRIPSGAYATGQNSFRSIWDWSEFLWES